MSDQSTMNLPGIEGGSLVQQAVQAVRAYIRDNGLKVGDTLPGEGKFASDLGVSRAVMREAFGALAALKLIDVANGRRARVGAIDGSVIAASLDHAVTTAQIDVAEVWEVRRTVECRIAALAAERRSAVQAARIMDLAEAMRTSMGDMAATTQYDIAFHEAIADAAGNALFAQIVRSFGPLMAVAVPAAWQARVTETERQGTTERHLAVARAIQARDPEAALAAMEDHFEAGVGNFLNRLRQQRQGAST
jgi:DNA-binding FadR family transcriptional regulator